MYMVLQDVCYNVQPELFVDIFVSRMYSDYEMKNCSKSTFLFFFLCLSHFKFNFLLCIYIYIYIYIYKYIYVQKSFFLILQWLRK